MKFVWRISGARYRMKRVTAARLLHGVACAVFAVPPYRWTLVGRLPRAARLAPGEAWPGDAARGAAIVRGDFPFAGEIVRGTAQPWDVNDSPRWRAEVNGFDWLRDLRASGGDAARTRGRELVLGWIEAERAVRTPAWRPDVIGARIANWIGHTEFLQSGADEAFRDAFHASLARQSRHLGRIAGFAPPGVERIVVLKGLIFAALALSTRRKRLGRWLARLDEEIGRQVLGDGGHVERSPAIQLAALRHLVDIRAGLREAQQEIPAALQGAIDRMAPMLRFFRHGDGGLALFNDTDEGEGWLIDVVLTRAEARGKPLESAPHSGFERLHSNRTLLLMDVGAPPPVGYDRHAHAGALAFELSVGKERLVVNCGAHPGDEPAWRYAQRTTAAHSTLAVEDVNSAELLADGGLGHRPERVGAERKEADGSVWIDARHDGYVRSFGLVHHRRLYLGAGGGDLRGEDSLEGTGNRKFAVRFHLHPSVKASLLQEGATVLLRQASGAGWRLRATGGALSLQDSIYLSAGGQAKRSRQVVVSGATNQGRGQIKWALTRVTGKG